MLTGPLRTVAIVGSRRRDSEEDFRLTEAAYLRIALTGDRILSGGCPKGGDRFAVIIAQRHTHFPIKEYLPNRDLLDPVLLAKNPRAAYAVINYARNSLVALDADVMIACVALDRKGGTEDTIKKFRKRLGVTEAELMAEGKLILV